MPGEDFHLSVMAPLQAHIHTARSAARALSGNVTALVIRFVPFVPSRLRAFAPSWRGVSPAVGSSQRDTGTRRMLGS